MAIAQALEDNNDNDIFYNDADADDDAVNYNNADNNNGSSSLEMTSRSIFGAAPMHTNPAATDAAAADDEDDYDYDNYNDQAESSESDDEDEGAGLLMETSTMAMSISGNDNILHEDDEEFYPEDSQPMENEEFSKTFSSSSSSLDPHAADLGGTLSSATLGIIKGMVGPAILYLPHGFASAGYLVAIPVLMLSTVLFLWSSSCLLECWKMESHRVNSRHNNSKHHRHRGRIALSYPALAKRAFGTPGEKIVQVGISLMQSGVCLTYLIFVPQNLRSSAMLLLQWDISTNWTLALMVAVQVPLSYVRDIRRLTVTNLVANVLILYGLVTCLGFAASEMMGNENDNDASSTTATATVHANSFTKEILHRSQSLPPFNPSGWFLFLGTSVLLFEGSITLLIPLQEAVQSPSDRDAFPRLYSNVIRGIVTFYSIFGMTCWMAFGNDVHTVMTTSLPSGTMASTVQLAYSLAVVFTFPLQNFPSLEIVCGAVERLMMPSSQMSLSSNNDVDGDDVINRTMSTAKRNIISTLLVVCLSIVAVLTMEDLDKVVSLMGSLLGCPLAFVVPPLIQNRLGEGMISESRRCCNVVVAVLGVGAMVISSITTILKWD